MKKTLQFAFLKTIPILLGFLFLGIAFGLLLEKAGYGVLWAFFISTFVYAGSMQFVLISFLGTEISLLSVALMTLSVNCRHMFYGLSFLDRFKAMGKAYPYMIYTLTDETYSLLCSTKIPKDLKESHVHFSIASLNQFYWVLGSVLGAIIGELIHFDSTGIDFAMTALFLVIFLEQWLSVKNHQSAILGLFCGVGALLAFGPKSFILPALAGVLVLLLLIRKPMEAKEVAA